MCGVLTDDVEAEGGETSGWIGEGGSIAGKIKNGLKGFCLGKLVSLGEGESATDEVEGLVILAAGGGGG